jgi:hypothetical protein
VKIPACFRRRSRYVCMWKVGQKHLQRAFSLSLTVFLALTRSLSSKKIFGPWVEEREVVIVLVHEVSARQDDNQERDIPQKLSLNKATSYECKEWTRSTRLIFFVLIFAFL